MFDGFQSPNYFATEPLNLFLGHSHMDKVSTGIRIKGGAGHILSPITKLSSLF